MLGLFVALGCRTGLFCKRLVFPGTLQYDAAQTKADDELQHGNAGENFVPQLECADVGFYHLRADEGVLGRGDCVVDVRDGVSLSGERSNAGPKIVVDDYGERRWVRKSNKAGYYGPTCADDSNTEYAT